MLQKIIYGERRRDRKAIKEEIIIREQIVRSGEDELKRLQEKHKVTGYA